MNAAIDPRDSELRERGMLLARRLAARRAWLESQRRIRELQQAERAARIKAAQDRALERWAEERTQRASVTNIEEARR